MTNNQVATQQEVKHRGVIWDMADRFEMNPPAFEAVLRSTVVPQNTSKEQFAAFLMVAKEYNLNPLTKEIYAFPAKSGGITPIVSIDGWVRMINSHPMMDGLEFEFDNDSNGELVSCTCKVYRKDRTHPIIVTEYFEECKRNTDPWRMKRRMLRHKALIQAARYAFGFGGIMEEDEYDGMKEAEIKTQSRKPSHLVAGIVDKELGLAEYVELDPKTGTESSATQTIVTEDGEVLESRHEPDATPAESEVVDKEPQQQQEAQTRTQSTLSFGDDN